MGLKQLIINNPTSVRQIYDALKLIEAGEDPNTVGEFHGTTILWPIIDYGSIELVKKAVQLGVDLNVVDRFGSTAIDIACRTRNYNMVEFLMKEMKIDPNEMVDGETRLHVLCTSGRVDNYDVVRDLETFKIIELFVSYGADINNKDVRRGVTPFTAAKEHEQLFRQFDYTLSKMLAKIGAHE